MRAYAGGPFPLQSHVNCTLSPPLDRRSEEPSDSACVRALGENCFSRAQMFEEARFLKCEAHAGGQWELAALHLGACRLDWNFRPGTAGPIAYSRDRAGSHWGMIRMEFLGDSLPLQPFSGLLRLTSDQIGPGMSELTALLWPAVDGKEANE